MNGKLVGIAALCAPVVLAVGIAMTPVAAGTFTPSSSATDCLPEGTTVAEGVTLSTEQWTSAATIIDVGVRDRRLPLRAAVIAVATAMEESELHGDDGLFGRDTDPVSASGRFYDELVAVPGWDTAPLTASAQAVQDSDSPYAPWEPAATTVVVNLTVGCHPVPSPISDVGWTSPVPGSPVCSGYRTPERPAHDGVDICSTRGTPIRAAASGVVITMECNASKLDGTPYSCDVDGGPTILGCGWYVEILHISGAVTRYCHMGERPKVEVGQLVKAGQHIGFLGSSGNSSGPHLHLETHTADPAYPSNATEPTAFFAERGVARW